MKKVLFILGTRPELIKFAPLIHKMRTHPSFKTKVCFTGQHKEMLYPTAEFFGIQADYDLALMVHNQSLTQFLTNAIISLESIIKAESPDLVFVQGDTSTVLAGSLAAYYSKSKIAHLEAGLRSHNKYNPFPEEMNRSLCSRMAEFHFAPTQIAQDNLNVEGIQENIYVVGNTVIDALFLCLNKINEQGENRYAQYFHKIDFTKKIILLTCHRRESFGAPFLEIVSAIQIFANRFPDIQIVFPVHLNPNINEIAQSELGNISNVILYPPLDYPYLVWILNKSNFVVTDSGGIQEEAPSLGKPVLVLRETTERIESIHSGNSILIGHDQEKILHHMTKLCQDQSYYDSFRRESNPYGDGHSADQIIEILNKAL